MSFWKIWSQSNTGQTKSEILLLWFVNKPECKGMNKYTEMAHQVDPEISGEYKSFKRKEVV